MDEWIQCPRCSRLASVVKNRLDDNGCMVECPSCGSYRISGVHMDCDQEQQSPQLVWREVRTTEIIVTIHEVQTIEWTLSTQGQEPPQPFV